jgi:uncharacterized membrane protein affecting hemolysin expression
MLSGLILLMLIAGVILGGLFTLKRTARTGMPKQLPKPLPPDEEDD